MLAVEKLVLVRFVGGLKDSAAQFGHDADLHEFVFKEQTFVRHVLFVVGQTVQHGVRVRVPLRPLINAARKVNRVEIRRADLVGRQNDRFFPDRHGRGIRQSEASQ